MWVISISLSYFKYGLLIYLSCAILEEEKSFTKRIMDGEDIIEFRFLQKTRPQHIRQALKTATYAEMSCVWNMRQWHGIMVKMSKTKRKKSERNKSLEMTGNMRYMRIVSLSLAFLSQTHTYTDTHYIVSGPVVLTFWAQTCFWYCS